MIVWIQNILLQVAAEWVHIIYEIWTNAIPFIGAHWH